MTRGFIKGDINQMYLLSPSIDDWVSNGHPVRFIKTGLDQINLMSFYKSYAKEGSPPYDPNIILGILIYSCIKGMRSSRKISNACKELSPFALDNWQYRTKSPCYLSISHTARKTI